MDIGKIAEEKSVEEFLDEIAKGAEEASQRLSKEKRSEYREDVEAMGLAEAVKMLQTLVAKQVRATLLNNYQQALIREVLKEAVNVDDRKSLGDPERYKLGKINKTQIMTAATYLNFL